MENSIYEDSKILVVDDVEEILKSTKMALNFEGMNVETYSNPIEALEYLKNNKVDVLLLDYYMPQMNGDQFIQELRKFNKETVIILRTGYSDKIPPMQMLDSLNIQGYIDKLKGDDELMIMIKSAIKTAYLYKQTLKQQQEIDALKYRDEFFGKFLYRVIGEVRERFFVISGLIDSVTGEEERAKLSKEEIERYTHNVKDSMDKVMQLIRSLEIEKIKVLTSKQLSEILMTLFKLSLQKENAQLNIIEQNEYITFNCDAKTLIYMLVDIIEHLLNANQKIINIELQKNEDIEICISSENIIKDEVVNKLNQLSRFDNNIEIRICDKSIILEIK